MSHLFRWHRRLVEARREVFLVVNVSVCFRRGSSQGEAVLVRDRFDVEFNLVIGGLDGGNVGFSPLFRQASNVCGQWQVNYINATEIESDGVVAESDLSRRLGNTHWIWWHLSRTWMATPRLRDWIALCRHSVGGVPISMTVPGL